MKNTWKIVAGMVVGCAVGYVMKKPPPSPVNPDFAGPISIMKANYYPDGYQHQSFVPFAVENRGIETKVSGRPADPNAVWILLMNGGSVKVFAEKIPD